MVKTISMLLILVNIAFPVKKGKRDSVKTQSAELSVKNLSKKWLLDKYKVFFRSYPTSENEKGDYIHFNKDLTFSSVSEGIYSTGVWRLNKRSKRIFMSDTKEEGELVLIVKKLTSNMLVVVIDDPDDDNAKYLDIHFKAEK